MFKNSQILHLLVLLFSKLQSFLSVRRNNVVIGAPSGPLIKKRLLNRGSGAAPAVQKPHVQRCEGPINKNNNPTEGRVTGPGLNSVMVDARTMSSERSRPGQSESEWEVPSESGYRRRVQPGPPAQLELGQQERRDHTVGVFVVQRGNWVH